MKQGADIYPAERRDHFIDLYERREWRLLVDEFNEWGLCPYRLEYCCGINYARFWAGEYLRVWKKDTRK